MWSMGNLFFLFFSKFWRSICIIHKLYTAPKHSGLISKSRAPGHCIWCTYKGHMELRPNCVFIFVQPWVKRLGTTGAAHHVGQKAGHFKHLIAAVTLQGLPHTHETTNYSKRKQSNIAKRIRFNKFDDQKSKGSVLGSSNKRCIGEDLQEGCIN